MKITPARALLQYKTEDLIDLLEGPFIMRFDDGDLLTNDYETCLSSYAWNYHRVYPKTPFLKKHHLTHILGDQEYTGSSHLTMFGNAMWSVYDAYRGDPAVSLDTLMQMAYRLVNLYYNESIHRLEADTVTLDITHFNEVLNHPVIAEAKRTIQPTNAAVHALYKTIEEVLKKDPSLQENALAMAARSKLSNLGQILQCVGVIGFRTDMDSNQFRHPILHSYAEGITKFHDSLVDSRSAALALGSSERPLEETEYFSRRLQLVAESLRNLHRVDCGSQEYLEWIPRPALYDEGHLLRRDDLETLAGKYFLNADGSFTSIQKKDTHLYGQLLRIRSSLHCAHPDPYGVCERCYGQTAESIPDRSNLGQTNTAEMTQQSGQSVLSIKHLLVSAVIMGITLNAYDAQFFAVSEDRTEYLLQPHLAKQGVRLVISAEQARNMSNIINAKNVDHLNASRIAELSSIGLLVGHGETAQLIEFAIGVGNRMGHFTYPLLRYIRKKKWSHNEKGHYVIDMAEWNFQEPILTLPMRHASMADHAAGIADIIESSMKNMGKRVETAQPDEVLQELHDHVNSKLVVPLAVLEVILLTAMAVSVTENDYAMPKVGTGREMSVMLATMKNRSLSAFMAFQKQGDVIHDPHSFVHTNRLSHIFDWLLMPEEASQYNEFDIPGDAATH